MNCTTTRNRDVIPCLYIRAPIDTQKVLIYFHGNAEDIGHSLELLYAIRNEIRVNVLAVEYPGFGVYTYAKEDASEKSIYEDAHYIMEFITKIAKVDISNIIIIGRSIGSGPATEMASIYNP